MTAAVLDRPATPGTFPQASPAAEPLTVPDGLVRLARELTNGALGSLPTPAEFAAAHPDSLANPNWFLDPLGVYARMGQPDFGSWMTHAGRAGGCSRPVRLTGGTTTIRVDRTLPGQGAALAVGHVVESFTTTGLPDGMLYKPCGTRHATLCPACAHRYRYDTYQVIRAGLAGGKGVPESVTEHPAVFVTLTAPSFGVVHSGPAHQGVKLYRCRPRRDHPTCGHGRPAHCPRIHRPDDPQVGRPLCDDCYDHDHAVIWNHFAPRLWDRTITLLRRELPAGVKVRYAKVAEFQRRGAVHLHAVLRLDGHDPADPEAILAPPPGVTVEALSAAIDHAAASAALTTPPHPDRPAGWHLVWGDQGRGQYADVRIIRRGVSGAQVTEQHVAGYLAKYSTKGAESTGQHAGRLTDDSIGFYADHSGDHNARLLAAAWHLGRPVPGTSVPLSTRPAPARQRLSRLGERWTCPTCARNTRLVVCLRCHPVTGPADDDQAGDVPAVTANPYGGLRRWAHMLGFGGHFSTKSRRYSTTLGQLRADRAHHAETTGPAAVTADHQTAGDDAETTLVVRRWNVVGFGWKTPADRALAGLAADAARQRQGRDPYRTAA